MDNRGIPGKIPQGADQIVGDQEIVGQGRIGILIIDQRVRCRGLLRVVDHCFWYAAEYRIDCPLILHTTVEQGTYDLWVGGISDDHLDLAAGILIPDLGPFLQSGHRIKHPGRPAQCRHCAESSCPLL